MIPTEENLLFLSPEGNRNSSKIARILISTVFFGLFGFSLTAGQWHQFRGPNASGVSESGRPPVEFGPSKNLIWKVALPPGKSSPILTKDNVFVTAYEGQKLLTLCLDRKSGRLKWLRELVPARSEARHVLNDPASPSPVSDGQNVYVFFGEFGLVSYAPDGRERWRVLLGPFRSMHGMASSPILYRDTLILACDHDENSFLIAIEKNTGKVRWKKTRPGVFSGSSTPVIYSPSDGPAQVLVLGSFEVAAYVVSTGEKLWWVRGFPLQPKSVPVVGGDTVYCAVRGVEAEGPGQLSSFVDTLKTSDQDGDGRLARNETEGLLSKTFSQLDLNADGFIDSKEYERLAGLIKIETALTAIRPNGKGDLTATAILWQHHKAVPHVPSPLLYQRILYLVREGGILTAFDSVSGAQGKQGRLQGALGDYYASPVCADNKIYLVNNAGKASVIKAGLEWEVLAVNDLDEECFSTPALDQGRIYIRTKQALYSFGERNWGEKE